MGTRQALCKRRTDETLKMNVFPLETLDRESSDPANFTGPGSLRRIEGALPADPRVNVYRVHFEARSRTNWHTHSGYQMLLIVEGRCRYQKEGEPVGEADAGDVIVIDPGENHWHGAAPGGAMTHIALNVNAVTSWGDPVSEEEYDAG